MAGRIRPAIAAVRQHDTASASQVETFVQAAIDYSLNIPRYVAPAIAQGTVTFEDAMQRLQESATSTFAAEESLIAILEREGFLA